ncbi:hypothetical protein DM558_09295 [Entomomonas moraniae]|uniref:Leucine-rich repeat domain-containing protein n=1 Tax=Entomomonas moraniae TaxID=2213226 RepID=A0A3S9XET7_9GAMM|nr:hypothetical protein [Entomomonas moraniae]AZS50963.1 hypothetical protein DM558_09295 [Entomomonas moraniae]
MMDLTFLKEKLQEAPAGFGPADLGVWLQEIPHIQTLTSMRPLLFENLSRKQWLAFIVLFRQRYIKDGPAYNLFDDHFEQALESDNVQDDYTALTLYEDQSHCLDLIALAQLTKLLISASRQLNIIKLPLTEKLEALELSYLPQLKTVQSIEETTSLLYLTINHCPMLSNFSFIKKLKKLLWLDLSGNEQITDLSFLMASSQVVILQLLDTHVLDNPKTVKQLLKLKHLRYLTIAGKQAQIASLREELPYCVVNGMSALNNLPKLLME